uniref:Uncharacterized protein n=1 Tax=Hemiselmis andersenii TaxID=464988 RepID=A0A6U5AL12_HEMAN
MVSSTKCVGLCLLGAAGLASAFSPSLHTAPALRASPLGMSMSSEETSCAATSRRAFLGASAAAAVFGMSGAASAEEKVMIMEMELTAPSEEEDKARIKREFQKMKEKENKSSKPRWQQDLEKQRGKKEQARRDVKNRDELCEVLGRGC